jgi:hypothetical protein
MRNRQKIEQLREETSIDYAFGLAGLLTLADAIDEMSDRLDTIESRSQHDDRSPGHCLDSDRTVEMAAQLAKFSKQLVKLAKHIERMRG